MRGYITREGIAQMPEAAMPEVRKAMECCTGQVKRAVIRYKDRFPEDNSDNGFYRLRENIGWTTGFWTGEVWLAYENAADDDMRRMMEESGRRQVLSFLDRIRAERDVDHHDMGFLFTPSCVAAYMLTGMQEAREAAVAAADRLISRFQPVGGFIQAWGAYGAPDNYRFIIDCLLNLPLLYWASEETGDKRYREIADRHVHTAMKYVIREDDSTWHTVFMNPVTGEFDHGATCQGYQDGSAWARGQAWGIYGTALAYKYTKREEYIGYFRRITGYYLEHLPADLCPYWDLMFSDAYGSDEPRDSSSAAIAACGLLEMSRHLDGKEKKECESLARKFVKTLIDHYQVKDPAVSDGQLLHGVYAKKTPYNTCRESGVDECVIWGDYYFMEALNRMLNPDWNVYW